VLTLLHKQYNEERVLKTIAQKQTGS
jgi:hypothetical protein